MLIHKKNESSLLGDGSGNSSDSDEDEDNDTSWMEELQEEGTSAALESFFVNNNTEIVSGVAKVLLMSIPLQMMLQLLKNGELLSMGQVMFLNFFCCQKSLTSIARIFTNIFVQETCNVVSTGPNEAVGMSKNLISMLKKVPFADGDGELFSGDER